MPPPVLHRRVHCVMPLPLPLRRLPLGHHGGCHSRYSSSSTAAVPQPRGLGPLLPHGRRQGSTRAMASLSDGLRA
jgi:hypothetical protein